ncbi:AAA family ATPase [Escherichia coli]|uniref:AAA family ATPase n=1 Tax=Escherichia coli TaxID=562 RepID=UPI000BE36569|nr:AAA family ATPase [Escherichia coli]EFA7470582.1 AAA family ATPase [Escherichia coli]EFA7673865.1 AAA family ATPase [Escherichia coli]EFA7702645.1 AAA family ATPase [Escherichia coli]EGK3942522.1 AAA family ATPase [Escherichia coli]MBB7540847.1 AAA family ATPase [Escherichia coli]
MIKEIYEIVEEQYFSSGDFNGLPIYKLDGLFDIKSETFKVLVRKGIEDDILTACFGDNPHIKAFSKIPKDNILKNFDDSESLDYICLYPHENMLAKSSKLSAYSKSPYEMELARGAGQFDYRTFDLSVLEYYRNDPRYSYFTDFIHGEISITDEYYESDNIPEHDQILLKTFGFAYDDSLNRYVAVFLRYLSDLSPEHQNVWAAKEVKGDIKLHPDYYAASILGAWGTKISIFSAFTEELKIINKMSVLIGKAELFRKDYSDDMPKEFGFLLRPTRSEFNNFMLLLDKMMSDNLNKKFFEDDVELEIEEEREDGKIVVRPKGTIQILESWLDKYFQPTDPAPVKDMIDTFRKVRQLRQKPAHAIDNNNFNQEYFKQQRDIVIKAYVAIRTLRLILASHPNVKKNPPKISEHLYNGEIWDI